MIRTDAHCTQARPHHPTLQIFPPSRAQFHSPATLFAPRETIFLRLQRKNSWHFGPCFRCGPRAMFFFPLRPSRRLCFLFLFRLCQRTQYDVARACVYGRMPGGRGVMTSLCAVRPMNGGQMANSGPAGGGTGPAEKKK